jgi:glycosyltransferase involved in cell wall biosynthesis
MPKVSVIIPTYNRGDIIERAIHSALTQTLRDIEVIIVDDASTDNTGAVISRIDDPRIRYIKHNENSGGSAARNTGIDHAKGQYIAFLDSDDSWKPTKLEKQLSVIESRSSEWVGVYCDFKQKRSNLIVEFIDNIARRPTGLEGDNKIIDSIFLRTFAHGGASTLFIEKKRIDMLGGFDESFERHQDLEFLIRLLQTGKLAYTDEVLVYKYDTGNPSLEVTKTAMERFKKKFESLIEHRDLNQEIHQVQQFMIAKYNFRDGDLREGFRNARQGTCPHYRDLLGITFAFLSGMNDIISSN